MNFRKKILPIKKDHSQLVEDQKANSKTMIVIINLFLTFRGISQFSFPIFYFLYDHNCTE